MSEPFPFAAIVVLFSLLVVVFDILICLLRGGTRSFVRLLTQVLSAAAALVGAPRLAKFVSGPIVTVVKGAMANNADLQTLLNENPEVGDTITMLVQMMVGPLLFFVIYLVLKFLTLFIYLILRKLLGLKKARGTPGRVVGVAIGVVSAAIGVVVLLTPVLGYSDVVSTTLDAAERVGIKIEGNDGEMADGAVPTYSVRKTIGDAVNAPVAGWLYQNLGAKNVFSSLTTVQWGEKEEETSQLSNEALAVVGLFGQAMALRDTSIGNYGDAQTKALQEMAGEVKSSRVASTVLPAMLRGLSNAWSEDRSFFGVDKPSLGEDQDVLMEGYLTFFGGMSSEHIAEDMYGISDVFSVLVKHDVFSAMVQDDAWSLDGTFMKRVSNMEFLNDLREVLDRYGRMKPMMDAVANVGIRRMMRSMPDDYEEKIGKMAEKLKAFTEAHGGSLTAESTEELEVELKATLAEHNIDVEDEVMKLVTQGLLEEFKEFTDENGNLDLSDWTAEQITERLLARFEAAKQ